MLPPLPALLLPLLPLPLLPALLLPIELEPGISSIRATVAFGFEGAAELELLPADPDEPELCDDMSWPPVLDVLPDVPVEPAGAAAPGAAEAPWS